MPIVQELTAAGIDSDRTRVISPALWAGVAVVTGLLAWTYWLVLPGLVLQWWNEEEYSHGFIVPLVALAIVWYKWDELGALPTRPAYSGLLLMVLSLAVYATGIIGADMFLQRVSMVSMIAGGVLYVTGWRMFRAVSFPIAYLLLMVPLPHILFNSIAFPLQLLAAQIATDVMKAGGLPVFREGNVIHLVEVALDVEEACSGIRSLLSLAAIGVPLAYIVEKRWWGRLLIVVMVVPVAVIANVFRVTVTGVLAHYLSVDTALGLFHSVGGLSVFMLGTLLLFAFSLLVKLVKSPR